MSIINKALHFSLTGVLMAAAVTVSVSAGSPMYKGYEIPEFTVAKAEGPFEVRTYAPHVVAEVDVDGDRGAAIRRGFRLLASFIFGENAEDTKISMTAPVTQTKQDGQWQVQFMMPAQYTPENLPAPTDDRIRFRVTPVETQAVIEFSGRWTERKLTDKARLLEDWIEQNDLQVIEGPRYYFYDDPFTLPMRRRNEVAYLVN